jgi:hypothetical protein
MNEFLKTGVSTVGTTAVIAPEVYGEPITQAAETIITTGDLKAPLIALASSVIIQLVLKGLSWVSKKLKVSA